MPKDYYNPVPETKPQLAPTPKVHITFPHVEITGAVGQALANVGTGYGTLGQAVAETGAAYDKLGRNFDKAGDEIWARAVALKELQNDKIVNDAVIKHYEVQGKLGEQYRTTEGDAATQGLDPYMKSAGDATKAIEESLPNEQAKKAFRSESRGMLGAEIRQSVNHAATQTRNSTMKTVEAQISMQKDIARKAESNEEYDAAERKAEDLVINQQRHLGGWSDERTEYERRKVITDTRAGFIENQMDSDPKKGMETLERNKNVILDPVYSKLKQYGQEKMDTTAARNAADRATQDPDLPLKEQEDKARKLAREYSDTPEAEDKAVQRVRSIKGIKEQADRDQQHKDSDVLADFIAGRTNPEGKKPTKEEEIGVNDKVKAAWSRQTGPQKNKWLGALSQNSKEDYIPTPATMERYRQLLGLSDDPSSNFRDLPIVDEKIPWTDRNKLLDRQRTIAKEGRSAQDNPQVAQTLKIMKANGVLPKELEQDPDRLNILKGGIHDAVIEKAIQNKGKVTDEEKLHIGKTLLREVPGSGWLGSDWFRQQTYQKMRDMPQEFISGYKAAFPNNTEEEMAQDYARGIFRREFKRYYGGGSAAPSTTPAPNTTPPGP